jgi:glucuronyl/N-acetylglucosaminyl transferase EXT2
MISVRGFTTTSFFTLAVLAMGAVLLFRPHAIFPDKNFFSVGILDKLAGASDVELDAEATADDTEANCQHFSCFDVYRCGAHPKKMLVHIPDPVNYVTEDAEVAPWTKEHVEIMEAIEDSEYYTPNPDDACVFVLPVDLLNEAALKDHAAVGKVLKEYKEWNGGMNNVVFNMLPAGKRVVAVPHGKAMVAGSGMDDTTYRSGFDVSLPTFSPFVQLKPVLLKDFKRRRWTLLSSQINARPDIRRTLDNALAREKGDVLVLSKCKPQFDSKDDDVRCDKKTGKPYSYPQVLSDAAFCLVLPGVRLTQTTLMDAMHSGCIPVVAIDSLVLPFSEVLDWNRFSVRFFEHELKDVMRILGKISDTRLAEMSSQLRQTYQRHFSSMAAITRTTLDILNDRLFQHHSKTYFDWNAEKLKKPSNPLLMPKTPPAEDGFTAVILTYDRLESLFTVMTRVAETPSLAQILVVWNNQEVDPPPAAEWPKLPKPFQVLSICDLY